jgi:hypothetical protein
MLRTQHGSGRAHHRRWARMISVNAWRAGNAIDAAMMRSDASSAPWLPIKSAPFDCELELAVIDYDGVHCAD